MTIQRMIELLEIEHECMLRGSHDDCDRNCAGCELVQDDGDLHEMYTDVIALLKEHEAVVHPEPSCEITYITDCCCELCGAQLIREDNFCRCCGKRIEWKRR